MSTVYGVAQEFVQSQSIGLFGKRYVGYFSDDFDFFTADKEYDTGRVFMSIDNFSSSPNNDGSVDQYSWLWLGYFLPPTSGDYTFYTASDDASWVWVGEGAHRNTTVSNAVVNNGGVHGTQEVSGTKYLRANKLYPVKIMFGDANTQDRMTFSFSGPSIAKTTDGRGYFFSGPYLFDSLYNTTTRTYPANGYEPDLVLDFENNYFRVNGEDTDFDTALTHSRNGNATMVDSDGLIKWAPHNFVGYSDFSGGTSTTGWVITTINGFTTLSNGVGAINAEGRCRENTTLPQLNVPYVFECWVDTSSTDNAYLSFNGMFGAITIVDQSNRYLSTGLDVPGHPNLKLIRYVVIPEEILGVEFRLEAGTGAIFGGARIYRTDLGGMVNNPDTGDSYVSTTGSARYLARRGHHVYNGTEWVNEGVLIESEARTNLLPYSEDFSNGAWTANQSTKTASTETAPDGSTSAFKITENAGDTRHGIYDLNIDGINVQNIHTYSVYLKEGSRRYAGLTLSVGGTRHTVIVDLRTGSITDIPQTNILDTSQFVEDASNGWYRIMVSGKAANSSPSVFWITLSDSATPTYSTNLPTYQGNGTGSIHVWGAQAEQASTASSYIPTNGATVTRAAETLELPASSITYDAAGITLAVITRDYAYTNGTTVINIDGSGDERTTISWNKASPGDLYRINVGSATLGYGVQSVKFATVVSFQVDAPAGILAYIRPAGLLPYYNGTSNFNQANVLGVPVYDEPMRILTSPGSVRSIRMWKGDIEVEGRIEASTP